MKRSGSIFSATTLAAALFAPVPALSAETPSAAPAPVVNDEAKGMYVVITDKEPMVQMMALVLSTQTVEQGKSLRILLCGPAGQLAIKGSKQTMFKPLDKSPQMLLGSLISKGVKVEVCPLYLPAVGKNESSLVPGITVAKPPVVAKEMRGEGLRLMSF
jgi:predicted peroxiredoxin